MGELKQQQERLDFRALYKPESGYDVEFEVGVEGETWKFAAHKHVLAASSPVMKSGFYGLWSEENITIIRVDDVDKRAFKSLMRYLYGYGPKFKSVETALYTLYAAHKYICPSLELECAAFLNEQVQHIPLDRVLDILINVSIFSQSFTRRTEPSAPPAEDDSDCEKTSLVRTPCKRRSSSVAAINSLPVQDCLEIGEVCETLRHNCFQIIDKNADYILKLEKIEDLDKETFLALTSRDSLNVSDERIVLDAALRWAKCECMRIKKPIKTEFLRQALGSKSTLLSGSVARLLLLTPQQFCEGPKSSPILTVEEQKELLSCLVSKNWKEHDEWKLMAIRRTPRPLNLIPIITSHYNGSSINRLEENNNTPRKKRKGCFPWSCKNKNKSSPTKPPKEKIIKADEENTSDGCCGSKACEYLVIFLACIFD